MDNFVIENGVLEKYTGRDSSVMIPEGVNAIGTSAFEKNLYIEDVYIPDSVTRIRQKAFSGCRRLKKVRLPEYISGVEDFAFEYTPWIDSCEQFNIRIHEGVGNISADDFSGFSYHRRLGIFMDEQRQKILGKSVLPRSYGDIKGPVIGSIILPSGVKNLAKQAFWGIQVKKIQLNNGLEQIGEAAFKDCTMLEEVVVPDSVKEIGKDVFKNCGSDLVVCCADSVFSAVDREIRDRTAAKWLKGKIECTPSQEKPLIKYVSRMRNAFVKQLQTDNVEMMARILACGKVKLEQIEAYVEMMNDGKHPGVLAILLDYQKKNFAKEEISLAADKKIGFAERMIKDWEKIFRLKQDENGFTLVKYKGVSEQPEIPTEIEGTPVYAIGNNAFKGNESIVEIEIPGSIQSIGDSAFENCSKLKTVRFDCGLKHIGKRAFYNCASMSGEMFLPEGLLDNGVNAFDFGANKDFVALHLPKSMKVFKGYFGGDYSQNLYIHGAKTKYDSESLHIQTLYVSSSSHDGKIVQEREKEGSPIGWMEIFDEKTK